MKRIRTLFVSFANDIGALPVTAFRGAVIEKVGRDNLLFHHHLSDDTYLYKYPLIQYKKIGRQPGIFCIDAGVDEIHKLFGHRNWTIQLQGQPMDLKVDRLDMKTTNLNVWEKRFRYSLWNWQALNGEIRARRISTKRQTFQQTFDFAPQPVRKISRTFYKTKRANFQPTPKKQL